MSKTIAHIDKREGLAKGVTDLLELVKIRLTMVVVLTAVGAYIVASQGEITLLQFVFLSIGGFGVTGAANAINQVLEKDFDKLMVRTKNRPVAAERMTISSAVLMAGFMCLTGITALSLFNPVTAFFGMLAFILYGFVYTPLKRYSSVAVWIGAIAGAMPMLIGVMAFDPSLMGLGLWLFSIQFAWQFPHFWAIAFIGHKEYKKAGFQFVPTENGVPSKQLGISSVLFSIALLLIGFVGYYLGHVGILGLSIGTVMHVVFVHYSWKFLKRFNTPSAHHLMFYSLIYIPAILFVIIIDKIIF